MGKPRSGRVAVLGCALTLLLLVGCGQIPTDLTTPPQDPGTTSTDAPSASETSAAPSPTPTPSPRPTPRPARPNCAKLKCIALTYDDGPFPDEAGELVRTLEKYKVKATFFMLGQNVENYPDTVKDIAATGSELANHSWSHTSLPKLGNSGIRRELKRTNDAIEDITGVKPTLMRPPYGENNKRLDQVCRDLGLAEIYWDVDTLDWQNLDTDQLISYVLDSAARNQVVLMHDIHPSTVAAAPQIFAGLKKAGFTMVTVSELYPKLRPGGHYPEYQGRGFAKESDYLPDGRQKSRSEKSKSSKSDE